MANKQSTFTVHMLKTFTECPKKYEFAYIKKLRLPEDMKKTLTGNKLHNLINFKLKGQNISKLLPLLDEKELELWKNYETLELGKYIDSEYSFLTRCADVWLSGRIDALFKTYDGILIADWKTSDYILRETDNFQTMFYLYTAYNIFRSKGTIKDFSEVLLTYFVLSDSSQITVQLSQKLYDGFCSEVKESTEKINCGRFDPRESENCKNCSYKTLCSSS